MPKLTATPEMKQAAIADEPKQHESPYGYRYVERTYYPYMNCVVQDGILKAAFYLPEHLRLDGNNPAYEVFLDKKAHQFLTYDHLEKKWRDAKLDRLNWPGRNYYATCWASEKDAAVVQDYLCGERGGDLGILDFQRNVRDEQLEQRHKRITGAWDQDLAQVPELPKDWMRWIDKVAVRENFIFYRYKRGGAQNGYCTFCGKEVPISGHPYHNKKGRCACCRHPIVFKALGRAGYIRTEKDYAYLIQRCKDGFVLREFWAERTYWKDSLPSGKPYWHEFRRSIYDRSGEIRSYYWGVYCQRETRWISGNPCYYSYCGNQTGRVYGKSLPCMEQKELFGTGLVQWIRTHPVTDPEKYLAVWKRMPKMEQIWKADLPRLTKECFEHCDSVRERILYPNETRLIRALGLDGPKFRRLRQINGDTEDLAWLQLEKRTNQRIPDELFRWFKKERISAKDILFIADRMSPIQIRNYLQKQKPYFDGSCRQALTTWQDYLANELQYRNESEKSCEALRRIVQAELMGQFYKLKYFAGDLKQEIHYPIQEAREDVWKQNLSLTRLGLMAKEVDDFYHTIRMGELPHFTCLSCYQGSQRDCLLAAFDSNKKIILVYKDESVVARACLRLTKGSFQQPSTLNFEFADLSKEDVPTGSHAYSEKLVLFLEHIYTSGLKKSEETAAKEMVVALATQKAEELDAVAVLSNQYRGCYPSGRYVSAPIYIYISKSKNGRQYLDSLGGAAVTLAEEQYKQESFLVERAALDRAHAA